MNSQLQMMLAQPEQAAAYIEFLEEIALWLDRRRVEQWKPGVFRRAQSFYEDSIAQGEGWPAYLGGRKGAPCIYSGAVSIPEPVGALKLYRFQRGVTE